MTIWSPARSTSWVAVRPFILAPLIPFDGLMAYVFPALRVMNNWLGRVMLDFEDEMDEVSIVFESTRPRKTPMRPPTPVQVSASTPVWRRGFMDEALRLVITAAMSVAFVVIAAVVGVDARLAIAMTEFPLPRSLALPPTFSPARCTIAASASAFLLARVEGRPLEIREETSFAPSEPKPRPNPVAAPSTESLKEVVFAAISWSEET